MEQTKAHSPTVRPKQAPTRPLHVTTTAEASHGTSKINTETPHEVRKSNLLRRIGRWQSFVLLSSTALVTGALAFICFIWASGDHNAVWLSICLAGWVSRSVTLAALAIRLGTTAQAAGCTSMLAGLVLRNFGVSLGSGAAVTLMQNDNTGPHTLAWKVRGNFLKGRFAIGIPICLLVVTTSFLQFTSTILLSDVKLRVVQGLGQDISVSYAYNDTNTENSVYWGEFGYWNRRPGTYPTFAEYSEQRITSPEVFDTGLTLRGFVPVTSKDDREALKYYDGNATVIDTRVVCTRPDLQDVTVIPARGTWPVGPHIKGRIGNRYSKIARFQATPGLHRLQYFDCPAVFLGPESADELNSPFPVPEWALTICRLNVTAGILSAMNPSIKNLTMAWYMNNGPGEAHLVMNVSGSYGRWAGYQWEAPGMVHDGGPDLQPQLEFVGPADFEGDAEWLRVPSNDPMVSVSLSICFTAFRAEDFHIVASSLSNRTEPVLGWKPKRLGAPYDTVDVRKHLNALTHPVGGRGVLALHPRSWETSLPWLADRLPSWEWIWATTCPVTYQTYNFSSVMCLSCAKPGDYATGTSYLTTHQALIAVFNDIVRNTRHPALGIQAHYTTLFSMAYYEHAFQFDLNTSAKTVMFEQALAPTAWTGFAIIASVVAVHLVNVALIVLIFIVRAGENMIGNAWTAVAQLRSGDIDPWTSISAGLTDRELERRMKGAGMDNVWVGLKQNLDGEYVVGQKKSFVVTASMGSSQQDSNQQDSNQQDSNQQGSNQQGLSQ